MRQKRLLALALSGLAFGAWAGPAMADDPVSAQAAEQVAGNAQYAGSSATSTQYEPTNQSINVRVLSPGDNGAVTQSNDSTAQSYAGNENATEQAVQQDQSGVGGTAVQEAVQLADSVQGASSEATSTQVKPTNQAISVRVLSPGNDGAVDQRNDSTALSKATNGNATGQGIEQSQGASGCGCRHDGTAIQAAGQAAFNWQKAESAAESKQIEPANKALSDRFESPGGGGGVRQSNTSAAGSWAANWNELEQVLGQRQGDV